MAGRIGAGGRRGAGAEVAFVLAFGGGVVGETVSATYADGRTIKVVYATDPEGNIIELQGWS